MPTKTQLQAQLEQAKAELVLLKTAPSASAPLPGWIAEAKTVVAAPTARTWTRTGAGTGRHWGDIVIGVLASLLIWAGVFLGGVATLWVIVQAIGGLLWR